MPVRGRDLKHVVLPPYPAEVTPRAYGRGEFFTVDYWRFLGEPSPILILPPQDALQVAEDWLFARDVGTLAAYCAERDREALRIWNGET